MPTHQSVRAIMSLRRAAHFERPADKLMITFRQIIESDVPGIEEILVANDIVDQRARGIVPLGTSQDLMLARLRSDHAGWIAFMNGKPAGFAMANRSTGELWLIAVRPDCRGQAIGRELMRQAEAWLFSHGWKEIWLSAHSEARRRNAGFFHRLGWLDLLSDGERRLKRSTSRSVIKLEEHAVYDSATGYERLVRLQRGPVDRPHRLCLMLDGELYWRDMDVVPALNDLSNQGRIPAMTLAFVGHVSGGARHEDYTCNERYGHYIDRVVTWLKSEVSVVHEHSHVICGMSLSGLMAVYLTLRYPQHFGHCLSQSGSHWWRHEWFAKMARQQGRVAARFWLSVGDQETGVNVTHPPTGLFQDISQIAGVEKAVQVLGEVGGTVYCNQYHGGHSVERWREELSEALPWLLTEDLGAAETVDDFDCQVQADCSRPVRVGMPVEAAEQTAHSQERSARAAEPVCRAQGVRRDGTGTADD